MIPQEFKIQIFKTPEQWGSGLLYRLEMQKEGGITLYSTPNFAQRIIQAGKGINNPTGLAVDECLQIYFMDPDRDSNTCRLYRYDENAHNLEQLSYIEYRVSEYQCPARIIFDELTLWVNDPANNRILAFSRENYQIKHIIDKYILNNQEKSIEPIDIGLDEQGHLYILNGIPDKNQIIRYHNNEIFREFELNLEEPVGLAIDKNNNIWIIDGKSKALLRYKEEDSKISSDLTVELSNVYDGFQPNGIFINRKENIFISESSRGLVHQFDPDGSYIGAVPGFKGSVQGITEGQKGDLYISSDKGISRFSTRQTYTKEVGVYYSKTLDSGIKGCQWHRLALEADIPPGSILDVYYSSSDDPELKKIIDNKLAEKISAQKKEKFINDLLTWTSEPEKNPKDMLFRVRNGRYLWLKLQLSTLDEKVKPEIKQMKIFYPRISYLRYLPAIYQENKVSKEFLERFLSIFETAFYDQETKINRIHEYFDPGTVPENFLNWLASWLNVALEEGWPEEKKRQFIMEAYSLYKIKGTPSGIRKLIEIYVGKEPMILEHSRTGMPAVLGKNLTVGINSFLVATPVRGFRLDDDSILGMVALRDEVQKLEDPFLPMVHRFTVILDLSDEEVARFEKGLMRIIDEEKPAHTEYKLQFNVMREGMRAIVGVNTRLDYHKPVRLGITSTIGYGVVLMKGEHSGKVEKHARVGQDTELI